VPVEVDVDHAPELVRDSRVAGTAGADPGVVDEHVDAAEPLERLDLLARRLQPVLAAGADRDVRARLR
jgi:hypothetical protein